MRLLDIIPVPWTPYALTFSRDGTRLAIGGGTWYGDGGIIIRRLAEGTAECLDWAEFRDDDTGIPAVSSLCFSDDDQYLAASMWHGRWRYAPTAVFHASDTKLRLRKVIEGRDELLVLHTGVLLHGHSLIVRRHQPFAGAPLSREPSDAVAIDAVPRDWNLVATGAFDHLTSSRVIVRRGNAITPAARMASATVMSDGLLMLKGLDGDSTEHVPIRHTRVVTAISAARDRGFMTGGADGEIDAWEWDDGWRQTRLREPQDDDPIREIVSTAAGRLIAVTVRGTLIVDSDQDGSRTWKIPLKNSVRSLAAHPSKELIVVGFKGGGTIDPPSELAVVELD